MCYQVETVSLDSTDQVVPELEGTLEMMAKLLSGAYLHSWRWTRNCVPGSPGRRPKVSGEDSGMASCNSWSRRCTVPHPLDFPCTTETVTVSGKDTEKLGSSASQDMGQGQGSVRSVLETEGTRHRRTVTGTLNKHSQVPLPLMFTFSSKALKLQAC